MTDKRVKLGIADLKARIKELQDQEESLAEALHNLQMLDAGLSIGCIVRNTRTKKLYKVYSVSFNYAKPWITGFAQKSDGSYSIVSHRIYDDWEVV